MRILGTINTTKSSSFKSVNGNVKSSGTASKLDLAGNAAITADSLFGGNIEMNTEFATAAGKNLTLTANEVLGKIALNNANSVFAGTIDGAAKKVDITAKSMVLGDVTATLDNLNATASGGDITVAGTVEAGAGKNVSLTAEKIVGTVAAAEVKAGQNVTLYANGTTAGDGINLAGKVTAGDKLELTADNGAVAVAGVTKAADVEAAAAEGVSLNNAGNSLSGTLTITANSDATGDDGAIVVKNTKATMLGAVSGD